MEEPTTQAAPQPAAPLPAKHSHAAVWLLGILFAVTLVTLVAATVYFVQANSRLQQRVSEAQQEKEQALAALEEKQAEVMEMIEEMEEEVVEIQPKYEDETLSFLYPTNTIVNFVPGLEARNWLILQFLIKKDDGTVAPSGLELTYPRELSQERDGGTTFDGILEYWMTQIALGVEVETSTIDGRRAVKAVTGDLSGDTFALYIEGDSPTEVFRIDGAFLHPRADEILDLLTESLQFE
ncbi:hypothetical protein IH979_01710 [Patescibacteria group bacterium]|nr:hypothetical protein [Patescibacteria group bacterium]